MTRKLLALLAVLASMMPSARAATDGTGFTTTSCKYPSNAALPGSGAVREVGAGKTYATIQAAVNAASAGDTIKIYPGTYFESVSVRKDRLRIQGTDRNGVVLDGTLGNTFRSIGIDITGADYVVVENLTVRKYLRHGVLWWHAHGYWGRYITAYNNGLYGIYAFDSRCGQIDNSYASGNADSGFYVGECFPCSAVIHDIIAEGNALGYSGTNAGGDLLLRDSIWRHNGLGIVPNTLDGEDRPPQRGITIANNLITDNNNKTAPAAGIGGNYFGGGIVLAGGNGNIVIGNTVTDHELAGIAIAPLPDRNVWIPSGNTVWGNTVSSDPARFPDSVDLTQGAGSGPNNCWADNDFSSSSPPEIETLYSCGLTMTPPGGDPRVEYALIAGAAGINGRTASDWATYPYVGGAQPNLPDAGPLTTWLPALGL